MKVFIYCAISFYLGMWLALYTVFKFEIRSWTEMFKFAEGDDNE